MVLKANILGLRSILFLVSTLQSPEFNYDFHPSRGPSQPDHRHDDEADK